MKLVHSVRKLFGKPGAPPPRNAAPIAPLTPEPEPEEIKVPELSVPDVRTALLGESPPVLLDVREPYEWRQVRIPDALHIPMNSVPYELQNLPKERQIVVLCAHGSRSFGVTYFLRERGYDAWNLTGGITQWHIQGGEVEVRTA